MIWFRTKNTNPSEFHDHIGGGAEEVEKILIGDLETHGKDSGPYCRYLHIITKDAELTLELYSDNPDDLDLRNVGEDSRYVLDESVKK